MSLYASADYYRTKFRGSFSGSDEELDDLLSRASVDIDRLTFNRIHLPSLTSFQLSILERGCCYQADYISNVMADCDGVTSYSVGDVSISIDSGRESEAEQNGFSAMGYTLLKQTGLMWRGVR